MDLTKVLDQLRDELDHLDAAILSLERLQAKESARRGRPPKVLTDRRKFQPAVRRPSTSRHLRRADLQ